MSENFWPTLHIFKIRPNISNSHEMCGLDCAVTSVVFIMNVSSKSTHCLIMKNRTLCQQTIFQWLIFSLTNSLINSIFYSMQIGWIYTRHCLLLHNPFVSFSIIKCLYLGICMLLICLLLSVNIWAVSLEDKLRKQQQHYFENEIP